MCNCGGKAAVVYEVTYPPTPEHPNGYTETLPSSLAASIAANRVVGATWAKKSAA